MGPNLSLTYALHHLAFQFVLLAIYVTAIVKVR